MPYFAINSIDIQSAWEAIATVMLEHKSTLNEQCFALVDTSFDYDIGNNLSWQIPPIPLYFDNDLSALVEVSPVLIPLNCCSLTHFQAEVKTLLAHCYGRPMLSFLQASLDATSLRNVWQNYLSLTTQDSQSFTLRFADTRVLPTLFTAPQAVYWQSLCQPVNKWLYPLRTGKWQLAPSPITQHISLPDQPPPLSDATLAHFIRLNEADALIASIYESDPEELPKLGGAELYWLVEKISALANTYKINNISDQKALALAVFTLGEQFLNKPTLHQRLSEHTWSTGRLGNCLAEWLDQM